MIDLATQAILTTVSVGTSSVLLVSLNELRIGFNLFNNGSQSVSVTFGLSCDPTACSVVVAGGSWVSNMGPVVYCGPISVCRGSGPPANVTITELHV